MVKIGGSVGNGVGQYSKAILAGVLGALSAAQVALASGGVIDSQEWVGITIALLVGSGLVAAVPNAKASDKQ